MTLKALKYQNFNLYNFGKLGELSDVTEAEDSGKDRRRVGQIVRQSLFVALTYATVIHVFSMNIH